MARYWTCIYDYTTFLERNPSRACWADKRRRLLEHLGPGDVITPYIARVGWIGVWTAISEARHAPEDSPFGAEFPIIADYKVDLQLDPEQAMRPADLPNPHENLRMEGGAGGPYPFLFQASGVELPTEAGAALVEQLRSWEADSPRRTLTPRQTDYSTRVEHATTDSGTVSIPTDDTDSDETVDELTVVAMTEHTRVQRQLLELGRALGLVPWVTPDDRSKQIEADGTRLCDLSQVTSDLPSQFNDATNRTIRHIDVMWLLGSSIEAAFEIENSTSIYSGILRMADLMALQPNLDIPLYLVIPELRLDKAREQLLRPVFQTMHRPLSERCRILTYDDVDKLVDLANQTGGALKTEVIDQFAIEASDEGG